MSLKDFLKQTKEKCDMNAKKFAALELSCWDENHQSQLKTCFGFNDKKLKQRKAELIKKANGV